MKKKNEYKKRTHKTGWEILGLFIVLIGLSGCQQTQKESWETKQEATEEIVQESPVKEQNEQNTLWKKENVRTEFAQTEGFFWLETEDGFYYESGRDPMILMYWEEESEISVPLCVRPECAHSDRECEAARFSGLQRIRIWEDKMYYWCPVDWEKAFSDMTLCRCERNGTEEEVIYTVPVQEVMTLPIGNYGEIHEGYWYTRNYSGIGNEQISWVSKWSVTNKEDPVILYSTKEQDLDWEERRVGFDLTMLEGKLYWSVNKYGKQGEQMEQESDIYRYDPETEKTEIIYQAEEEGSWFLAEGYLYYCSGMDIDQPVYKINPETKEKEVILEKGGLLTYDGMYMYLTKGYGTGLWVYTLEGELIEHIKDQYDESEYYSFTTADWIIFQWGDVYRLMPKTAIGKTKKEMDLITLSTLN